MTAYLVYKALHILSFSLWIGGMVALPLFYAMHRSADSKGRLLLQEIERKALRLIVNPAMVLTFVFGILLLMQVPEVMKSGWMHAKLAIIILLTAIHGLFAVMRKRLARTGDEFCSALFYRLLAALVLVLFAAIIMLAIAKPF